MNEYLVFQHYPYEGFGETGFETLEQARSYAKSCIERGDVGTIYVVKNMGL